MRTSKVLVIAEAGVNHNGDLDLAKQLIDVAADAGADLVKFQTYKTERLVTTSAQKADYQKLATDSGETQYEMLKRLELTTEMHHRLIEHCHIRGIEFFSTGFDIQSVDFLLGLGLTRIKVPSGEITNLPYLRHVGGLGKFVLLSTGMADMEEIEAAILVLEKAGTKRDDVTVLHCSTNYPTPMPEVHLRAMQSIQSRFNVNVGYSDHTQGIEVAIAAVALGASVIEKHFTLDRNLPGPDQKASLEPGELKSMVLAIRNIESALGSCIKKPSSTESKNRQIARKSLVAKRPILEGELFTPENLVCKRPGTGISPMRWDEVIGKSACRNFKEDELIHL